MIIRQQAMAESATLMDNFVALTRGRRDSAVNARLKLNFECGD